MRCDISFAVLILNGLPLGEAAMEALSSVSAWSCRRSPKGTVASSPICRGWRSSHFGGVFVDSCCGRFRGYGVDRVESRLTPTCSIFEWDPSVGSGDVPINSSCRPGDHSCFIHYRVLMMHSMLYPSSDLNQHFLPCMRVKRSHRSQTGVNNDPKKRKDTVLQECSRSSGLALGVMPQEALEKGGDLVRQAIGCCLVSIKGAAKHLLMMPGGLSSLLWCS
ncbi:hypothetical protein GE09DRAFT_166889 [Coniochaeta sp. 2T2.1]|nr:hypothetical protein GE09DRAFT_166889 [Coniochaeta sp. 2T2.1]